MRDTYASWQIYFLAAENPKPVILTIEDIVHMSQKLEESLLYNTFEVLSNGNIKMININSKKSSYKLLSFSNHIPSVIETVTMYSPAIYNSKQYYQYHKYNQYNQFNSNESDADNIVKTFILNKEDAHRINVLFKIINEDQEFSQHEINTITHIFLDICKLPQGWVSYVVRQF